jgi:hypothetical protein
MRIPSFSASSTTPSSRMDSYRSNFATARLYVRHLIHLGFGGKSHSFGSRPPIEHSREFILALASMGSVIAVQELRSISDLSPPPFSTSKTPGAGRHPQHHGPAVHIRANEKVSGRRTVPKILPRFRHHNRSANSVDHWSGESHPFRARKVLCIGACPSPAYVRELLCVIGTSCIF